MEAGNWPKKKYKLSINMYKCTVLVAIKWKLKIKLRCHF